MEKPDQNDYLTDEESDEGADFEIKVPDLGELIQEFEQSDETIQKLNEGIKQHEVELKSRGFETESRYDITNKKGEKQ
jgi:hypothetical protein